MIRRSIGRGSGGKTEIVSLEVGHVVLDRPAPERLALGDLIPADLHQLIGPHHQLLDVPLAIANPPIFPADPRRDVRCGPIRHDSWRNRCSTPRWPRAVRLSDFAVKPDEVEISSMAFCMASSHCCRCSFHRSSRRWPASPVPADPGCPARRVLPNMFSCQVIAAARAPLTLRIGSRLANREGRIGLDLAGFGVLQSGRTDALHERVQGLARFDGAVALVRELQQPVELIFALGPASASSRPRWPAVCQ